MGKKWKGKAAERKEGILIDLLFIFFVGRFSFLLFLYWVGKIQINYNFLFFSFFFGFLFFWLLKQTFHYAFWYFPLKIFHHFLYIYFCWSWKRSDFLVTWKNVSVGWKMIVFTLLCSFSLHCSLMYFYYFVIEEKLENVFLLFLTQHKKHFQVKFIYIILKNI